MAYHHSMEPRPSAPPQRPAAPPVAWWVATGFGSGLLKPAPGTWGSLAGLLAWVGLVLGTRTWPPPVALGLGLAAPLLVTLLGVWAADRVAHATGTKDPSFIVIDEWAGQWLALTPLLFTHALHPQPWGAWALRLAVPFALFRLFDIWKPGPVDAAQRLPGGLGIVLDDVVAGLLAALLAWPVDLWLGGWLPR